MKFLLTHERIGLEISNHYSSCSFHPMSTKLYEDIGDHGGIQSITSLGQKKKKSAKKMLHFEILTWESMGKPKMWNISERVDRLVERNRRKFGTRGTTVHMQGVFLARLLEFGLGLFDALCKISNSTIFEMLLLHTTMISWHLVPKIIYSTLKLFKTFLCTGSTVQADRQGPWASCSVVISILPVFFI